MTEMPNAFSTETRKSRKQHKCCECGKTIEKGELYQYSSGVWDKPCSFKQCLNCHEIFNAASNYVSYDEPPSFEMLREWFEGFQCINFKGEEWLNGMAAMIYVEPEKLDMLLNVHHK